MTENPLLPILIYMEGSSENRGSDTPPRAGAYKKPPLPVLLLFAVFGFSTQACAQAFTKEAIEEQGLASYYAGKFQGRLTANGEIFDTNRFTAAHKTLPFNTIVKVKNDATGESVLVRINDRGPFIEGRIIDLSRAAAEIIGMVGTGLARVTVEVVELGDGKMYHKTGPPEETVTIQIGAFRKEENAHKMIRLLESIRMKPAVEKSAGGLTKVILPGISTGDIKLTRLKLAVLGLTDVLIRH